MSALTDAVKKVEDAHRLTDRLEKIVSKLYDVLGEESIVELVEAEVRMEFPWAEKDRIGITSEITWEFKDIIDRWIDVYSDDSDESNDALRRMGDQFCKLGRMFHEAADMPAEQ